MRSQEGNIQDSESMNRGGGPSSSHVSIIHNIRINPRSVFTIPRVALELFSIFYLEEIRDISLSLSLREVQKSASSREKERERSGGGRDLYLARGANQGPSFALEGPHMTQPYYYC